MSASRLGTQILAALCALASAALPANARIVDLDVVAALSDIALAPTSGIYFDRPPEEGGTVFVPFALQSGGSGPTNGLHAALEGRIRVDFRSNEGTLAIVGHSTLFAPLATGAWLPGVPGAAATPSAAQAAAALGSAGSFATGQAALRELALTIPAVTHALVAAGAGQWDWPDGPFDGATPDVVQVGIAGGRLDFAVSAIPALASEFVAEGARRPLVLSASSRARILESSGDRLELRLPLDLAIEKAFPEPLTPLPLRVRIDLTGELVARNFVPEPGAAAAIGAAFGALALLARRRGRVPRRAGVGRAFLRIAAVALLIGVGCPTQQGTCISDTQCTEGDECVDNECVVHGTACQHPGDCANGESCDGTSCQPLAPPGGACEGDGDCESDACDEESGTCDGCEGDGDCDGVHDGEDDCPTSPPEVEANPDGCFETRTQPDGTQVFCNTQFSCTPATPDGRGPCSDCAYRTPEGIVWNGFGSSLITSFTTALHSTLGGVISFGGFQLDCSPDASCNEQPGGDLACEGAPGQCQATWPQQQIDCGATDCVQRIDVDAIDESFVNTLSVTKQAEDAEGKPADGSFDFELPSDGPEPFTSTIQTSNGVGVRRVTDIREGAEITVSEIVPAGWELLSIDCTGASTRDGDSITVTGFDSNGSAHCFFLNSRTTTGALLPIDVENPDGISIASAFGLSGGHVGVAGSNGFVFLDPLNGTIPSVGTKSLSFLNFNYRNLFGGLAINKPGGGLEDMLFAYRNPSGGSFQGYFTSIGDFGAMQLDFGAYRDALHLGDDPEQTEAVLTTTSAVLLFGWTDFGNPSGGLFPNTTIAMNNFTGLGTPVSAFALPSKSRVLAVTNGAPGKVLIGDPAQYFMAPTVVGDAGNDSRRVRALDGVFSASNFGSDSLTIGTWDGASNAAITATQAVGDGPLGLDMIALPGGNVAIGNTNFNDSSYSITVVSSTGAVLASSTRPADTGCVNPAHPVWLDVGGQLHLVFTCFGSDALQVSMPEIPAPPQ